MKISTKILVPLLAIVTFAACSDLFNRGNSSPELTLNTSEAGEIVVFNGDTLVFQSYGPGFGDTLDVQDLPPFQYRTEDQNILINGYFYSPSFHPHGSIKKEGNIITVKVHPPKPPEPTTSMPSGYLYDAYISSIGPGSYTVQIIHEEDFLYTHSVTTELDTVFTKEIVVE